MSKTEDIPYLEEGEVMVEWKVADYIPHPDNEKAFKDWNILPTATDMLTYDSLRSRTTDESNVNDNVVIFDEIEQATTDKEKAFKDLLSSTKLLHIDEDFKERDILHARSFMEVLSGDRIQGRSLRRTIRPHLRIFYGPMYGGKSRALFKHVLNYALCGHRCLVFKFDIDNRYDENDMVSHDNHRLTADTHPNITLIRISRDTLAEYLSGICKIPEVDECTVIAIDEGHFANGAHVLRRLAEKWIDEMSKVLIVAGLNLWASGDEVTTIMELVARAEKPKFKTCRCRTCNENNAIRSVTISDMEGGFAIRKDPETKPGGKDVYTSICRSCYNVAKSGRKE